ncbi:MAG TPA: TolC family protein [Rhodanobacteraceae bacterium]|nr:TolC family protein [Rhodanobacteraceae bacterium]
MQSTHLDCYTNGARRFNVAFIVAALILARLASAADSGAPLALFEAVRLADAQSPAIAARRAAMESATDAITPAGALPDPQLIAGVDNLPVSGDDAFSLTRDFMTMRKIGVMQEVTGGEKRRLRAARAQAAAAREAALLTSEELSVRESVARAWIACATAEQKVRLLHELEPRAQTEVAAAAAALSSGRGSAADGIAAKTAQAMLADRISQAEREAEDARSEFVRWLPEAGERPLGDAPDWGVLGRDPDSLVADAAHHRQLLAYDAAEQMANSEVALARAEKHPDWSVEFDYAQRGPHYSNMISLEFRVGLPLFAGSRQDPAIASKQAAVAQLAAEREDARRMHTAELRKTVAAWRSARERVARYESELVPLADARAEATLAAFRGGRSDLQASLAAFDQVVETRIAMAELRGSLGQAWAALHFAFPQERQP